MTRVCLSGARDTTVVMRKISLIYIQRHRGRLSYVGVRDTSLQQLPTCTTATQRSVRSDRYVVILVACMYWYCCRDVFLILSYRTLCRVLCMYVLRRWRIPCDYIRRPAAVSLKRSEVLGRVKSRTGSRDTRESPSTRLRLRMRGHVTPENIQRCTLCTWVSFFFSIISQQ